MIVSVWRNPQRLFAGKKLTSSFTLFLRYCKDIVNLLFWVLWACLAMHTQSDTINFHDYLHAKNQLHPPCFFGDISKICKLVTLGTLGMPSYTHPKRYCHLSTLMFIYIPKIPLSLTSFLRYYILNNPAIWLANSILAHNFARYGIGGQI